MILVPSRFKDILFIRRVGPHWHGLRLSDSEMIRDPWAAAGQHDVVVMWNISQQLGADHRIAHRQLHPLDLSVEMRMMVTGTGMELLRVLHQSPLRLPRYSISREDELLLQESSPANVRAVRDLAKRELVAMKESFEQVVSKLDINQALARGTYLEVVSDIERVGVPVAADTYRGVVAQWPLVANVMGNAMGKWSAPPNLRIGEDGRARCPLRPFSSITGRNQPSSNGFVFGLPRILRHLIQPEPGMALAYLDYEKQEFGINAYLSRCPRMIGDYLAGDPYSLLPRRVGLVPEDITDERWTPLARSYKLALLAIQNGAGIDCLVQEFGLSDSQAEELLEHHRTEYPTFWKWIDSTVSLTRDTGCIRSSSGWTLHAKRTTSRRTIANFSAQANGADMLRLACIDAIQAGVTVCTTVHDALLIEAPIDEIEDAAVAAERAMREASRIVLSGAELRVATRIVRHPDTLGDNRSADQWELIRQVIMWRAMRNSPRASIAEIVQ
jgi:hypothetical protein